MRCSGFLLPEAVLTMILSFRKTRCFLLFLAAVLCDVAGLVLLLLGICRFLSSWDFFVYTGALLLAFSLLFWVFGYTLNIEVPFRELGIRSVDH